MKISVIGGGVSGTALALLAKKLGHDVLVSDKNALPDDIKLRLDDAGISYETGHTAAFDGDMFLLSSGIPPHAPVIIEAENKKIPVVGEFEFVLPHLKGNIIGITGTNGKSTVTTLIGHLIGDSYKTAVGGNLGEAMANFAYEEYDFFVLELSSAQLHYLKQKNAPNCKAVVMTNITPDHIDWHGSYVKYVEAKSRLISLLAPDGWVFLRDADIQKFPMLNLERAVTLSWDTPNQIPPLVISREPASSELCESLSFFTKGGVGGDCSNRVIMQKNSAEFFCSDFHKALFNYSDSPLIGKHNAENAAFALALIKKLELNISEELLKSRLGSYKSLPHRCEMIAEIRGVRYINDSKGTNVSAAVTALNSIDGDKIIILGGKGKGDDYTPLALCVGARAQHAILLGSEKNSIAAALRDAGFFEMTIVDTISEAVTTAAAIAAPGDTVLLSPACTSWDQYKNYGERGEDFRLSVKKL